MPFFVVVIPFQGRSPNCYRDFLSARNCWFIFCASLSTLLFPRLGIGLVKILLSRQPKSIALNETNDLSSARCEPRDVAKMDGCMFECSA